MDATFLGAPLVSPGMDVTLPVSPGDTGDEWDTGDECDTPGATRGPSVSPSLRRVSVGAELLFCREGCSVAVDTGASYITGPAGPVSVLMKAIGATEVAEGEVSDGQPRVPVSPRAAWPLSQRCRCPCSTWWTASRCLSCPTSPSTWEGRSTASAAPPMCSG